MKNFTRIALLTVVIGSAWSSSALASGWSLSLNLGDDFFPYYHRHHDHWKSYWYYPKWDRGHHYGHYKYGKHHKRYHKRYHRKHHRWHHKHGHHGYKHDRYAGVNRFGYRDHDRKHRDGHKHRDDRDRGHSGKRRHD